MSKKIFYLGPYRHPSGYSRAALDDIVAINSLDKFDLYCHNIVMDSKEVDYSEEVKQIEKKGIPRNPDIVIQRNIPTTWYKTSKALCVGCYAWETDDVPHEFIPGLSIVDRVIVPTDYGESVTNRATNTPITVIPHRSEKFGSSEKFNLPLPRAFYKFYSIGEYTERKGWDDLVISYLSTFTSADPVALVIKTSSDRILNDIGNLKERMGRDNYPKIAVITNWMSDGDIEQLHNSCDCFVTASHGEGFCYPFVDALVNGKQVVAPSHSSFNDFSGYSEVTYSPNYCLGGSFYKKWYSVNKVHLGYEMQQAFNNRNKERELPNTKTSLVDVAEGWRNVLEK